MRIRLQALEEMLRLEDIIEQNPDEILKFEKKGIDEMTDGNLEAGDIIYHIIFHESGNLTSYRMFFVKENKRAEIHLIDNNVPLYKVFGGTVEGIIDDMKFSKRTVVESNEIIAGLEETDRLYLSEYLILDKPDGNRYILTASEDFYK